MSQQVVQGFTKDHMKKAVPPIRTGMTVRVHQRIKEGQKERVQVFEGVVIKMSSGHGTSSTMTVRKVVDSIGVEKVFPLHGPTLEKIEVKKHGKVRQSKLYFLRERSGKSAKLYERANVKFEMPSGEAVAEAPSPESEPSVEAQTQEPKAEVAESPSLEEEKDETPEAEPEQKEESAQAEEVEGKKE